MTVQNQRVLGTILPSADLHHGVDHLAEPGPLRDLDQREVVFGGGCEQCLGNPLVPQAHPEAQSRYADPGQRVDVGRPLVRAVAEAEAGGEQHTARFEVRSRVGEVADMYPGDLDARVAVAQLQTKLGAV